MRSSSPAEETLNQEAQIQEAKAAFHLRLRARGVRDLAVLRAFEIVPRASFMLERYRALVARDLPLPIPCGQTSHEPWRYALAVEALGVEPGQRVLEVGSGSGYVTAILAQLGGEVLGLERWAPLAEAAQARLEQLGLAGARVAWGDGLAPPVEAGRFDRILAHGTIVDEASFDQVLMSGGRLVSGIGGELILREEDGASRCLGLCPFAPLLPGLAGAISPRDGSRFARPAA